MGEQLALVVARACCDAPAKLSADSRRGDAAVGRHWLCACSGDKRAPLTVEQRRGAGGDAGDDDESLPPGAWRKSSALACVVCKNNKRS